MVDSLKSTELIFSYSALSRWPEPPVVVSTKEESKAEFKATGGKGKGDKGMERGETRVDAQTTDSGSVMLGKTVNRVQMLR